MKTDQELIRKGVPLRIDGLVKGAKTAVEQRLLLDGFDEIRSASDSELQRLLQASQKRNRRGRLRR